MAKKQFRRVDLMAYAYRSVYEIYQDSKDRKKPLKTKDGKYYTSLMIIALEIFNTLYEDAISQKEVKYYEMDFDEIYNKYFKMEDKNNES